MTKFQGLKFEPTPPPVPVATEGASVPADRTRNLLAALDPIEKPDDRQPVPPPADTAGAQEIQTMPPEEAMTTEAEPAKVEKKAKPAKAEKKAKPAKAEKKAKPAKAEKKAKPAKAKPAKAKPAKAEKKAGEGTTTEAGPTATGSGVEVEIGRIKLVDECSAIRSEESPERDDKAFETLVASVRTLGVLTPLTVERRGGDVVLMDGHRRLRAAKEAGLSTVPVSFVELDAKRKAVAKMLGRDADKTKDAEVRQVIGVVANTARRNLNEADVARNLRRFIKLDQSNRLTDTEGNPNVAAISRILGTPYGVTRNRVAVLTAYDDEGIGRIDAAAASAEGGAGPVPFSWGFVHEVLTRPKKYAALRPVVDGIAAGTATLEDLKAVVDGAEAGNGSDPDGDGGSDEKARPDEVSVKLNPAYFETFGMKAALVAAPRVPAKLALTFVVELGGETLNNLQLNGAKGRGALIAAVSAVQKTVQNALTGDPSKGDDERTRVTTETLGMLAEARDAAASKLAK